MQLAKSNFQFFGNKKNYMKYLTKDHNNMDYYKQIQNRIYILYERVYLDFIFHVCYSLEPWQICGFPSYVSLKLLSYVMPLSKIPASCSPSLSSLHTSSSTNFTDGALTSLLHLFFQLKNSGSMTLEKQDYKTNTMMKVKQQILLLFSSVSGTFARVPRTS